MNVLLKRKDHNFTVLVIVNMVILLKLCGRKLNMLDVVEQYMVQLIGWVY